MKIIANSILSFFLILICANSSYGEIIVEKSTANTLTVLYKPELQTVSDINIDGEIFVNLVFKDAGNILTEIGYPQIQAVKNSIAIPNPNGYTIKNIDVGPLKKIHQKIAPVYILGREQITKIDQRAYKNRTLEDWATVEYSGIGRDKHLANLSIIAAKYNPFNNSIEIPEYIRVTIGFNDVKSNNMITDKRSSLNPNLLNSNVSSFWTISDKDLFFQYDIEKNTKGNKTQELEELSSGSWFKINLSETGVYELDANYLKDNGINIPADKLNTIKIFGNGGKELPENVDFAGLNQMNQQPITVKTNGDGSLRSIIFFGAGTTGFEYSENKYLFTGKKVMHYINHFSKSNNYMLTWGGDEGLRSNPIPNPSGNIVNNKTTYTKRQFFEEEIINAFHGGSGKQFFGRTYFSDAFEMDLYNVADEGTIEYDFSLAHSNVDNYEDGVFTVSEQGKTIADNLVMRGNAVEYFRQGFKVELPVSELPNKKKSKLKLDYSNQYRSSAQGVFDYYEIHYPSKTIANEEEIYLFTDPSLEGLTKYEFTGFDGEIYAYDISNLANPTPLLSNGNNKFTLVSDLTLEMPKRYFISSKMRKPNAIEKANFGNYRSTKFNKDVILVTNSKLKESAKKFKEYREANSDLSVGIFFVDEIYNEYNAGTMDISAIRDFVSQAIMDWDTKPRYLVLWGDGHFDYRNLLTARDNLVPPHETDNDVASFDFIYSTSTDDFFARTVGNDRIIDIAVGRVPISSEQQGNNYLNKIKIYEQESDISNWRTKISLVADDGFSGTESGSDTGDGARFVNDSEELAEDRLPGFLEDKKIYSVEYQTQYTAAGNRKPAANADILKTVNEEGVLLLNWYGHGNPQVWSHEAILERDVSIQQMTNMNRLFFLTAATCDFAKFDNYDSESGAEMMLLNEYGGSIGSFAASRVVYASQNHSINKAFYRELFTRTETNKYPTLGETIFNLKQTFNSSNDEKYFLIGDPTVRLLIPDYEVVFEEINGIEIQEDTEISVKGLQTVKVSGHISTPNNVSEIASEFNGNIKIKVVDGEIEIKVYDSINRLYEFKKQGGTLSNANFEVKDGIFTSEFILPKDISFSENTGKIFGFAYTEDDKYAKGNFDNLKIDGIITTNITDKEGPNINIYLDSRKFNAGDIVRNEPLLIVDLEDGTGINSTGIGVGHKIEAWLDDNEQSIDLTSDYESSFDDYKKGTATKNLLNLEPGIHTVKIRAWDIYNNYSVSETYFNITNNGEVIVEDVFASPTPFENNTVVIFNHNLNPPLNVEMDIFDVRGLKINTITKTVLTPYQGEIEWNGNDAYGTPVNIGTYYFRLKIDNLNANETFLKGHTIKIK